MNCQACRMTRRDLPIGVSLSLLPGLAAELVALRPLAGRPRLGLVQQGPDHFELAIDQSTAGAIGATMSSSSLLLRRRRGDRMKRRACVTGIVTHWVSRSGNRC